MRGARDERSREGETLAGKYKLEERLGVGGMGEVYRATNTVAGRAVAIKMMLAEHANDPTLKQRFLIEARAANLVRHPNVVDVLDVGADDDGVPFMVQELLEGEDLAKHVGRHGGRLSPRDAVKLLLPIAEAVGLAHSKGVVHRDIKPENVFLSKIGRDTVPKLLDFGISQIAAPESARLTATGVGLGTPAYMAPEQIRSARNADARTDVWALGVLLFEVMTGDIPFPAESAAAMFVQIATADPVPLDKAEPRAPRALVSIVARCLKKEPSQRFADANALATALRAVLEDPAASDAQPVIAVPPSTGGAPSLELEDPRSAPTLGYDAIASASAGATAGPATPAAPAIAPQPFDDEEAPSGLRLATLRPPGTTTGPRREIALAAAATAPARSLARGGGNPFVAPVVLGAVVVASCVVLTVWSPLPQDLVRASVASVFDGLSMLALAGCALGAVAAAVVVGVLGAKRAPVSWGLLVAACGLLLGGGLLGVLAAMGESTPAPPIAFAAAAALVPSGAGIAALRRAALAWRAEIAGGRAASVGLAAASAIAFFLAALFLRAGS